MSTKRSVLGSLLDVLPGRGLKRAASDGPRDRDAIQSWLVAKVAKALDVPADQIDEREPFASFGLDSRTAVNLSGDLERWLGRRLSPTLIWDYPTIETVAAYLADGVEPPVASSPQFDASDPPADFGVNWSEA